METPFDPFPAVLLKNYDSLYYSALFKAEIAFEKYIYQPHRCERVVISDKFWLKVNDPNSIRLFCGQYTIFRLKVYDHVFYVFDSYCIKVTSKLRF